MHGDGNLDDGDGSDENTFLHKIEVLISIAKTFIFMLETMNTCRLYRKQC